MVSTRRSGEFVEEANALTLRSRTIDVESRHQNSPNVSHGKSESGTPRKRRKVGGKPDEDASDVKAGMMGEKRLVATTRSEADAGEETASSPVADAPGSTPMNVGNRIEDTGSREQVDAAPLSSTEPDPAGIANVPHRIHKRFRSEEPESDIGNDLDSTAVATESSPANAQTSLRDLSTDSSDDEAAPETLSTTVKQNLPFTTAAKEPKRKKRKPTKPTPADIDHGESPSASSPPPEKLSDVVDDQMSLPIRAILPTSKRNLSTGLSAPRRAKDVKKDGVIYRTVASDNMRGQTSAWLPAKASQESKRIKDGLLVRKRVQEVWHGRRVKFVTSR